MPATRPGLPAPPPLTRPADFDAFWERTRSELAAVPADLGREPAWSPDPALVLEELTFSSLGGARIRAYAITADDGGGRPLAVHGHGYESPGAQRMWSWARSGVDVVGVDVRGYGRSGEAIRATSPHGYVLTGVESPERHVLRGAVCDYMRTVEVARELFGGRMSRLVLTGMSFAGGLALMAEAQLEAADLLVLRVPSLGWMEGRRQLADAGSAAEIDAYVAEQPQHEQALMSLFRYFDTMNFADRVRCPTLLGYGREDHVVPAESVLAIAGHLTARHELIELPVSHSSAPEEARWQDFDDRWLALAREGVPPGFGGQSG